MKYLPLFLLITACGLFQKKHKPVDPPRQNPRLEELRLRFEDKMRALALASDVATGWPDVDDCDGTLWAGLALFAGEPTLLDFAEYAPGEIHRRPKLECYPAESGSTVSNDMILGYLIGRYSEKNLLALQRLADYGEAHNWRMGEGDEFRTLLRPNGYGLLGRMIYNLSDSKDDRSYRKVPPIFTQVSADYERHLLIEGIEINGKVDGNIPTGEVELLEEMVKSEPRDHLAQSVLDVYSGDFSRSINGLLDDGDYSPSYVRGATNYPKVYWLRAAKIVLGQYGD